MVTGNAEITRIKNPDGRGIILKTQPYFICQVAITAMKLTEQTKGIAGGGPGLVMSSVLEAIRRCAGSD